jgi:uncharacterized OB-fold protein
MVEVKTELVSLEPDVLEVGSSEEECHLLGNRCPRCGLVFFPRCHFCTRCCGSALEEIRLSRKGLLKSFTKVYQKPKYSSVEPPYLMGEIELPERVVVYSLLVGCAGEELRMGQEVELTTVQVREEERKGEKVALLAYVFRPCQKANSG